MTTQKQINANLQNALKSTGPISNDGKEIISKNATKHGIFSNELVIATGDGREDVIQYDTLYNELKKDLKPQGQMENLLVEKISVNYWRLRRLIRYETGELREVLDELLKDAVEKQHSDYLHKSPPRMLHYNYGDNISEDEYLSQKKRIDELHRKEYDLTQDDSAIKFILCNRLFINTDNIGKAEKHKAVEYINKMSPQQKGKLRQSLIEEAEEILEEMNEVIYWNKKFQILSRIKSIPNDFNLGKIIKYETSLERSIFRNLSTLRELQARRKERKDDENNDNHD
jgi:hypothetical protein